MLQILQSPEFGQFVANVLITLVAIVVPLIGSAVRGFVKSRENDTKFQMVMDIARMAVMAAEQAGLTGAVTNKKAAAINAAQAMLADRGISIDLQALDAAIEAAVASELNRYVINDANYTKVNGA